MFHLTKWCTPGLNERYCRGEATAYPHVVDYQEFELATWSSLKALMLELLLFAGWGGSLEVVWAAEILFSSPLFVLQGVQQVGGDPACTSVVTSKGEGGKFWVSCTRCFPTISVGMRWPSLVQMVCSHPLRPRVAVLTAPGRALWCLSTDTAQGQRVSR